jgi:hypothetical protein
MTIRRAYVAIAVLLFGSSAVGFAQGSRGDAILESLVRCRTIESDRERLACLDRGVAALAAARADSGLTAQTRDDQAQRRQAQFGLAPEGAVPPRRAERKDAPPVVQELNSTVTRVVATGRDRLTVTLADGSVWRTTEPARSEPEAGDSVRIRRAALGSYLATFAGGRAVRIERLR